jgi:nucleoside-diphosphate-sugar epimerase
MKVLVTGGGGFLGAWLTRRLLAEGHAVRVFDRNADPSLLREIVGTEAASIEWRTGDISDGEEVMAATEGCGGIAHLAAVLTPACRADPRRGAMINLVGTLNVFEAARRHGIRSLAYASSAGVFGPDDGAQPFPTTLYGAFKLACEGAARAYWLDEGIGSVGFRPLVIYGPGRTVGATAGPTIACHKALLGENYAIPFSGSTDMIFVDDVAAAFVAAATRSIEGAHVFNLRGEVASVEDVIAEIAALVPGARLSAEGAPVPVAPRIAAHDATPVLGSLPKTTLRDGLARTVEHYRQRLPAGAA